MNLKEQINSEKLPKHLAIIMDGNGRWAKKQGLLRTLGHEKGTKSVRVVVETCAKLGVENLTLYAFSTENWNRPKLEVDTLMKLLISSLKKELKTLMQNNIRLNAIGNLTNLPTKVQAELENRLEQKEALVKSQENRNLTAEEKKDLKESFMLGEADRYFMTNAEGEPNAFHFTVESDGRIAPHNIFMSALHILDRKIDEFMAKITKEQEFEIQKSDSIMFAYDFIFENEDYTLSYLFQNYLYQFYQNVEDPKIKYVGCSVPHPLENKMVIRIALRDSSLQSDYIKSLFQETSKEIKKIVKDMKNDMQAQKLFVLDK